MVTHPKNPNITRYFKEIGRVEELGSGIEKIIQYCQAYTGTIPVIKDENLFTFELKHNLFPMEHVGMQGQISLLPSSDQVSAQVSDKINEKSDQVFLEKTLLEFCAEPKSLKEILMRLGYSNKQYFRVKILNPLIEKKVIAPTQPDSPNSPTQKYYTVIHKDN